MKKRIAGFALFSAAAFAETWTGTVVDVNCKGKDLSSHTRNCAISCSRSGYGIVTPDGKFIKFDETGNTKALAALKSSSRDKDLKATVTGSMKDDVIQVDSIDLR